MRKYYTILLIGFILLGCTSKPKKPELTQNTEQKSAFTIDYAEGFTIEYHQNYKVITLNTPWPGATNKYTYLLKEKDVLLDNEADFDAVIQIPITSIVVTSTTHIPSLEMLEEENKLIGFPNTDYVSSEKTRVLIDNGKIKEIGKNEALNTELLIDMNPDVIVGFAVEGSNKALNTLSKTGIPIVYNADWTETSPLGKAEWIKFFGAFFNKDQKAQTLFNNIAKQYNDVKKIAVSATSKPTVLSGAMYKDIWYLPQGNSWAAQFIKDANAKYLWEDSEGTGSLSLPLEAVLDKGQEANYWIGPGQFSKNEDLINAHEVYGEFSAYKTKSIYTFTTKRGPTGGYLYYELAPNRPDIVLKDIVKILHPELLPNHTLFFFSPLQ